jgi:hypothetical protein
MRSRKRLLITSSFLVAALVPGIAEAQRAAPPPGGGGAGASRSSTQFTLRRDEAGGPDGTIARQRARAGDCAGALPAFDAAIRVTIEPTLRRDRGLCHEKLGAPFPAIDDYRAYLTASPDAPDADQIRDRLARLEESVGVGAPSSQAVRDREDSMQSGGSFSLGTTGGGTTSSRGSNRASATLGPRPGERERSYDYYANEERLAEAADSSPLRYGTGWSLGPFLMAPRFLVGDSGVSADSGFAVGGTFRYAWSPTWTFITEVGYAGLGTSGQNSSVSGPLVFAGVEARIPLDRWASNQLVLGVGPGYERYTTSVSQTGINLIEGRARFGYRHVFGPSVGLEFLVDGGPVYVKVDDFDGKVGGLIGGSFALVIGF